MSKKPATWCYEWDAEDRLSSVVTPDGARWRYVYDALGRRVEKRRVDARGEVVDGTTFTWQGTTLVEQVSLCPDKSALAVLTWEYDGVRPLSQTERLVGDGEATQRDYDHRFYAIVTDLAGAPTHLVDEEGDIAWEATTTLWGEARPSPSNRASTPLRFPGQYADPETGWHYNFHRHYDPALGRFTSPDPLGLAPAGNPVTYPHNPHIWSDPHGLSPCHLFRGTTRGYAGSSGTQRVGITPTSSDPGVATIFATHSAQYGDDVVQIIPTSALDGVPTHAGYIRAEAEVAVELPASELAQRATIEIPSATAREILGDMGIDVPRNVPLDQLSSVLENTPKLSTDQINQFVAEAARRA
ncbi:RHS repeat domain-containing protein [Streptomyces zhaozhouensis]|uniref:RHS repeat domain-containing protein n=1 Tax=Streptomyces zhaozhouensis TaxID=1300267 RepID=UPI001FE797DD|nr:RHS repeat-associated core domain-containing protein [Streptomyces zhaozhouensis]